jgi:hypothetical protein
MTESRRTVRPCYRRTRETLWRWGAEFEGRSLRAHSSLFCWAVEARGTNNGPAVAGAKALSRSQYAARSRI